MKSTNANHDSSKTTPSKSYKRSTKSRSKSSKTEQSASSTLTLNVSAATSPTITTPTTGTNASYVVTPTTPTSSTTNKTFDPASAPSGSGVNRTPPDINVSGGSSSKSHPKNYAGFEPRSIKIIWEQHDQSDVELSQDVCTRLAEDVSYKVWELINNIKIYSRHSGGKITYDIVNEVLRDADVPPALGALDSPWDRVDYDGTYYFYSDKIIELRDEYQKEIRIEMPLGDDFIRSWILEDKHVDIMQKYIPSLVYVTLHGDETNFEIALQEAAFSPLVAISYRVLLFKIIEILAFKQSDGISLRCWRLLRACAVNPYVQDVDCRMEYFHIAEILICQLTGPLECIKIRSGYVVNDAQKSEADLEMKLDNVSHIRPNVMNMGRQNSEILYNHPQQAQQQQQPQQQQQQQQQQQSDGTLEQTLLDGECIFRLEREEDESNDGYVAINESDSSTIPAVPMQFSPYFATPVDLKNIEELCWTLGLLAGISGYFQSECIYLINQRLERFFMGRTLSTEKEYTYIGRVLRGLNALGEFAFREFIPFIFKLDADNIPEKLWNDFASSAIFLNGPDDIFLYEWLEYICGDKLQAFMVYHAEYLEKLHTMRFLRRRQPTFRIIPKVCPRRLQWNSSDAAKCYRKDPNRAMRAKPKMYQIFPDLAEPNLNLNRAGNIRFKFAGCRPVILRPKKKITGTKSENSDTYDDANPSPGKHNTTHQEIIIAKRKLFKPYTDERRIVPLSSYFYARI